MNNEDRQPILRRIKRWLVWFLGNIILWAPAYYWMVEGNEYAGNYCVFMVGLHFITSLAVFSDDVKEKMQAKGPSVNMHFNLFVDLVCGVIMATFGHWFLAVLYIMGSKFQQETYTTAINKKGSE